MRILGFKPGHDASIAYIEDGELLFSLEGEKDSFLRYETMTPDLLMRVAARVHTVPDVISIGGWSKGHFADDILQAGSGYFGVDGGDARISQRLFFGSKVTQFTSSHERSHLLCSYGLSPFEQGRPCYALVWEGMIGKFYEITPNLEIIDLGGPLSHPGTRYSFLFLIAHAGFVRDIDSLAGKLMALAAFSSRGALTNDERQLIEFALDANRDFGAGISKEDFAWSSYLNCGVTSQKFKELAGKFSDALFQAFYEYAESIFSKPLPLLIGGGCGLNCEWNRRWLESGLVSDVFIPPCTNDSGSAIGTAIDAQFSLTGKAKLRWNVYAGEEFVTDTNDTGPFVRSTLDVAHVAKLLAQGKILGWIQGRYEIGPRALGNRSIIAAPFSDEVRERLNHIKQRESYRPIAPICMEEKASDYFDLRARPSPYMLFFAKVLSPHLKAVTHIDGSSRVQTVRKEDLPLLHSLLTAFEVETGFPVLCNTSLNFNGKGFINRLSDLVLYASSQNLDGFVCGNDVYLRSE